MNYANMIEEKNLKKTFIIATLVSTIIGTFTTGMGLYERLDQKRKQQKTDETQDSKIKQTEQKVDDYRKSQEEQMKQLQAQISEMGYGDDRRSIRGGGRRNGRRGGRDDDLRDSLSESGPLIRREYNRDFARFGDRFAVGDSITQNQLQGQVIMLQGTVIQMLQDAIMTGRLEDVNKLYNASELAREGSMTALQQQYQRMLQAAPVQRPMTIRRTSSQPSIKKALPSTKSSVVAAKTVVNSDPDDPLFCKYSYDLQRDGRLSLADEFLPGGNNQCGACGAILEVEQGRAWKVNKEIIRERISTPEYEEEVVEDRTYLVGNRFVIKCHRAAGGFACTLCARYRDKDTLIETPQGLIRHIWQKHDVEEYQDPDIKEIGHSIDKTRERRDSKA